MWENKALTHSIAKFQQLYNPQKRTSLRYKFYHKLKSQYKILQEATYKNSQSIA